MARASPPAAGSELEVESGVRSAPTRLERGVVPLASPRRVAGQGRRGYAGTGQPRAAPVREVFIARIDGIEIGRFRSRHLAAKAIRLHAAG